MRLKKDFLKIHFSNYACSVAREDPSDMPAKTRGKSVQTHTHTIQLTPTEYKGASRNNFIVILGSSILEWLYQANEGGAVQ